MHSLARGAVCQLLLIPEYSGINKGQRIHDRSQTEHRKLPVKCFLAAATAGKSLQSCPTLYDPIDGSPSGSAVPGILQARTLEWVAISFSNA